MSDRMGDVRRAVRRQLGSDKPGAVQLDRYDRFSDDLPEKLDPERRAALLAEAERLEPWVQGPFWLGGDVVVGGAWRNDQRWQFLGHEVGEDLGGRSVIDIGCNAGYDVFMFRRRGAGRVLGCEPYEFIEQARFLESVYRSGAELEKIGWELVDPDQQGRFDVVHCNGVLYHDRNPLAMIEKLFRMTAPGGTLLLGSMMLADPQLSDYARFVPGAYFGDPTWWWVPGPGCLRGMLETAGFAVLHEFGTHPGPEGEFPVVNGYFRAERSAG